MQVNESLSLVAKLVLDSMGESREAKTQLGIELFNLAKREIEKQPVKKEVINPEVDRKIRELKQVEGDGGISWMDFYSWRLLPLCFQKEFTEKLDPLIIWQGVFVLRFKLNDIEQDLWKKLPTDLCLYELKDLNSFHLSIIGPEKSFMYDGLSPLEFKRKKAKFEALCMRSIGNTSEGLIIKIKERKNESQSKYGYDSP